MNNTIIRLFGNNWVGKTEGASSIYVDGFADYKGIHHDGDRLAALLLSFTEKEIEAAVKQFNGIFVIIAAMQDSILLISDAVRSKTVQYAKIGSKYYITDSIPALMEAESLELEVDVDKLEELVASNVVYGEFTVYRNVFGLQTGEIVKITAGDPVRRRYFLFTPKKEQFNLDEQAYADKLDDIMLHAFESMIRNTPNVNRWVVPLSGGHDSRIVANYLYKLGVKNVICFSYGIVDNLQSRISQQVSEALGYPWYFVEYTAEKWHRVHENNQLMDYLKYAYDGMSTPNLQDFLAVHELKMDNILQDGDIIVPGHLLDALAGAYLQEIDFTISNEQEIVPRIMMALTTRPVKRDYVSKFQSLSDSLQVNPEHLYEVLGWQERTCKSITHSIRVYQFFGFDYRLPFIDKELIQFWQRTPKAWRLGRISLIKAEQNRLLVDQVAKIPFAGREGNIKNRKTRKTLKKVLPPALISLIARYRKEKPVLNEALNLIYLKKADTLSNLIAPHTGFPDNITPYFKPYLSRYTYQIEWSFQTALYLIRKLILKPEQ